jgi:exopolysaccharide biosynthesis protein
LKTVGTSRAWSRSSLFCTNNQSRAKTLQNALAFFIFIFSSTVLVAQPSTPASTNFPGITYTNTRLADGPLSIHVVQLNRANRQYEIESIHARGEAIGLDTLSDQLALVSATSGSPAAAINGDYYQRDKDYAGAPRGLQVVDGQLLSAPSGEATFWVDATGDFHADNIDSRFQIIWPDGSTSQFALNGERADSEIELYTSAAGTSTHTKGGRELILIREEGSPPWPIHVGLNYAARVREIRETADTPLTTNILVLSVGPEMLKKSPPKIQVGDILRISTATEPALHGVKTAISGGPMLIHNGSRVKLKSSDSMAYAVTTMWEQHPRAAIGWNEKFFFLVEVDGRQKRLSVGITLDDLTKFLMELGCNEAMNFDGGGSATLWFDGEVRNSPCDRMEREIANSLVIVRKKQ